jgi:hypothetical protein
MVLNDGSLWQRVILENLAIPSLTVPQRGTVSAAALDLAFLLTSGNIFIAGMDLSVRDIKTHVRPYGFDPLFRGKASRFTPFYSQMFNRAGGINRGESHRIYASWFRRRTASWPDRVFTLGNNNPVFHGLKPWRGKGVSREDREKERAEQPEGRCFGELIPVPAGVSAGRGAAILIRALSVPAFAEPLAKELSPLLFPGQKPVSAGELAEEILSVTRPYSREDTGENHG